MMLPPPPLFCRVIWMKINIQLTGHLKNYADDVKTMSFDGNTVRDLLDQLVNDHPELRDKVFGMDDILLVLILVDDKLIQKKDVNDYKITEKNEIKIYPIVGGG